MRKAIVASLVSLVTLALILSGSLYMSHMDYEQRKQDVKELTASAERYRETRLRSDLDEVIGALSSDDRHVQSTAAALLRQLGPLAAPAVDPLIEALNSSDRHLQREAILALGAIGSPSEPATPYLIDAMASHPTEDIGVFAAEALGRVANPRDEAVQRALAHASKAGSQHLRSRAQKAMSHLAQREGQPDEP